MTPRQTPKRNEQIEMEKCLASHPRMHILLHSCCAPCSSAVLERLCAIENVGRITIYFYNPNIIPENEYTYRLEELQRLLVEMPLAKDIVLLPGDYQPEEFLTLAKGLEHLPERGVRCQKCIHLRLSMAARKAQEIGADCFCTTLTVSPHKDSVFINTDGRAIAEELSILYLPSDFKKKEGYKRSIALSNEYELYRQAFCGCPFSKEKSN